PLSNPALPSPLYHPLPYTTLFRSVLLADLEENAERPTSNAELSQFDVERWALSVGRYGFCARQQLKNQIENAPIRNAKSELQSAEFSRILLIKPSALGDVVHTIPVLVKLRARYPRARIDWLITPENAEVVRHHPALSNVV